MNEADMGKFWAEPIGEHGKQLQGAEDGKAVFYEFVVIEEQNNFPVL